jgi:hypothetical protein
LKRTESPEAQLEKFLAKYTPEIAGLAKAILQKMRKRLRGAAELVYDNYNALVIGFAPGAKPSHAIFSIAIYPRWVNLLFLHGKDLRDPEKLLKGSGNQLRSIVLETARTLDHPAVEDPIAQAPERAAAPFNFGGKRTLTIRTVSEMQRPRRHGYPGKGVRVVDTILNLTEFGK